MTRRLIYCCACEKDVAALLVRGDEAYRGCRHLTLLRFWRCDDCRNFVGCHHKSDDPLRPLGCIPTPEVKEARKLIHAVLDPIWKQGHMERKRLYKLLSAKLGREYHTAELRTPEEATMIYVFVTRLAVRLSP
jgi:hypothetical protein